jgi:hypothetical protein
MTGLRVFPQERPARGNQLSIPPEKKFLKKMGDISRDRLEEEVTLLEGYE